uniref:Lipoprotein n=1 Tax=Oscillatoriales cyanobacterium SpSt-402 TaxID=2282168 RepID=A0A832H448_9CYAN
MLRVIWAISLAVLLTACGTIGLQPGKDLVEQAIALQLSQTRQELSQQLRLDDQTTAIKVSRINIAEQAPLQIKNLSSFRIVGTCDLTVKLPKRSVTQQAVPFEVYLQRQQEGKTWRVAFPKTTENGELTWVTQRIPTAVYK